MQQNPDGTMSEIEYMEVSEEQSSYLEAQRENYYKKEFSTFEEFLAEKYELEESLRVKFVYLSKPRDFMLPADEHLAKIGAKNLVERRSMWELNTGTIFALEFGGCPFFQLCDPLKYGCEFGRQLKPSMVTVHTDETVIPEELTEEGLGKKGKVRRKLEPKSPRRIKKVGCNAMIFVRKILRFSGISPISQTKRHKNSATALLKDIMAEWAAANDPISDLLERSGGEVVYVGYFPREEAHDQKHSFGEENNAKESIHPCILSFIKSLALEHGKFSKDLYQSVRYFVEQNFPEASYVENRERRKFWPSERTVKAIVYQTAFRQASQRTLKPPTPAFDPIAIDSHPGEDPVVSISETSEDEIMNTRKYVGRVLDIEAAKERLRTVVKNIESLSDVNLMEAAAEALESIYESRANYLENEPYSENLELEKENVERSFNLAPCGVPVKKIRILSPGDLKKQNQASSNQLQFMSKLPPNEEIVFYVDDDSLNAGDIGQEVSISS